MMMKIRAAVLLLLAAVGWGLPKVARAEDAPAAAPAEQSVTEEKSVYERIAEKVNLNSWSIYKAGSLSNPGNSLQPDANGNPNPKTPQSIESYIWAGAKLDPNTVVGAVAH